jgi:magnesium chelatase family protein
MLAETLSAAVVGVDGTPVRVEVDVAFGLPGLTIVGLAGSAIQEARDRVRSALRNSGFEIPSRRVTINLAPADLPKEGTGFDLPIAVGILAASGQLDPGRLGDTALVGELALDGGLRPVPGVMALAAAARASGVAGIIVAEPNLAEAATVREIAVFGAASLGAAVGHLSGRRLLDAAEPTSPSAWRPPEDAPDLSEVLGQRVARRAVEIAVAGRHNLALCGPPGIGKTLLLRCAAGLQPPLRDDEAIEVSRIYSVAGLVDRSAPLVRRRPFRAPHHTISTQALVGGGPRIRPGEASLAHRGVLMLDEALHFRSDALDALRQPLEAGTVTIARVDGVLFLPARFMLLAAFNPCPCGWSGSSRQCRCDEGARRRYGARLSGPLRDRLDLYVRMETVVTASRATRPEAKAVAAARIQAAWCRQLERQGIPNSELSLARMTAEQGFDADLLHLIDRRGHRFELSPRRLHRAARVARTIADLEASAAVSAQHLDEALRYRPEEIAA